MKKLCVLMGFAAVVLIAADADAWRITTADTGGADAELRESSATQNRGSSTEIASRIDNRESSYWKRNSLIYLKFGVGGLTETELAGDITVRTTYRNTNLSEGRIYDPDIYGLTGFDYFVLDPTADGADWDEMTIAPTTDAGAGVVQAPGYYYDGDMGTKAVYDFFGLLNPDLTYLGQNLYDTADLRGGHLPVGGAFDLTLAPGSALHDAIVAAQGTAHQTVTIVMGVLHDAVDADPDWLGFNYLFNPKEQDPLNGDPSSPWGGLSNVYNDNAFMPQLTNEPHIPEPATLALLGFGGLALLRKRK